MGGIQIVGVGMAAFDVLMRLRDMPTWEHGTALSDFRFDGGGPVATAMVASARLGARVGFVGTAGNDSSAELKLKSLSDPGVDISRVVRRDIPDDQVVIVCVHEDTGERVFSGVRRFARAPLKPEELDREYITSAQYLHLDGFHMEAAMQAAQWMREAGRTVVLDGSKTDGPVRGEMAELVRHVDVLISGSGFARGLTGIADIWEAGVAVLDMGPSVFVQTEGEAGSYTVTRTARFHVPAFQIDVVDTTGAGDVFHGAYIVGLLQGWDLRYVAQFSTAVSALKCTKLGGRAGIPNFEDVIAFLTERGIEPNL